jgi:hypothetical protein
MVSGLRSWCSIRWAKNINTVRKYTETLLVVRKEVVLEVNKDKLNCKFTSQTQCRRKSQHKNRQENLGKRSKAKTFRYDTNKTKLNA